MERFLCKWGMPTPLNRAGSYSNQSRKAMENHIKLEAKSSGSMPYTVEFFVEEGMFKATCDCRAGIFGQLCKHRIELMAGDENRLYDLSQKDQLKEVLALVSELKPLKDIAKDIAEAEKIIRQQQSEIRKKKNKLSDLINNGVAIE